MRAPLWLAAIDVIIAIAVTDRHRVSPLVMPRIRREVVLESALTALASLRDMIGPLGSSRPGAELWGAISRGVRGHTISDLDAWRCLRAWIVGEPTPHRVAYLGTRYGDSSEGYSEHTRDFDVFVRARSQELGGVALPIAVGRWLAHRKIDQSGDPLTIDRVDAVIGDVPLQDDDRVAAEDVLDIADMDVGEQWETIHRSALIVWQNHWLTIAASLLRESDDDDDVNDREVDSSRDLAYGYPGDYPQIKYNGDLTDRYKLEDIALSSLTEPDLLEALSDLDEQDRAQARACRITFYQESGDPEPTGGEVLYLGSIDRAGVAERGLSLWTDATSAENAVERYLQDEMDDA